MKIISIKFLSILMLLNFTSSVFTQNKTKNEIKRFMLFIDEVYENKVALIILSEVEIESLYSNNNDTKTNARVVSRLNEIKSDFYFNNSKYIINND